MPASRSQGAVGLAWALLLLAAGALYARLYFGVDFTDEGFYVGLPYSFSLGHRPLADELSVQQISGAMLTPFVELYTSLVGRDGLVLFVRHLYFAYVLLAAALVARYFGTRIGRPYGLLLACCVVTYVPYGIPSLSYNTLASLGSLAGLMLLASAGFSRRSSLDFFGGTFFLASACVAYPTLAVVLVPTVVFRLLRDASARERRRHLIASFGAAFAWLVPIVALLAVYGSGHALRAIVEHHEALGLQGGGAGKLFALVSQLAFCPAHSLALACITVGVLVVFRSALRPAVAAGLVAATGPLLWLASPLYVQTGTPLALTHFMLAAFALLSLPLLRLSSDLPPHVRRELAGVVAASFAVTVCIGWSSATGLRAAAQGLLPAALCGLALLAGVAARSPGVRARAPSPAADRATRQLAAFTALVVSLVAFEIAGLYAFVYRDAPVRELVARVESGAYAGLRTTPGRAGFVAQLEYDLERVGGAPASILFFDYFPAGYLFTTSVPRTPTLWMFPSRGLWGNAAVREIYAREIARRQPLPELVVVMKGVRIARPTLLPTLESGDPVLSYLESQGHARVLERSDYVFFRRPE